jgi:ComF family protein
MPSCPTCAASVAPYEVADGQCSECRRRPVRISGSVRVGHDAGRLAYLIRAYKYAHREELGLLLGDWLVEAVRAANWQDRIEAIVPVPTHWRRRVVQPFYPAERLAALIAQRMAWPNIPMLRRTRAGPHQIGLSYTARIKNVHGAFAVRSGVRLHDARLLLIDDVKTTGATIDECARILLRAGAGEVYVATIVKAGWMHATGGPLTAL